MVFNPLYRKYRKAIHDAEPPTNISELRAFIGLATILQTNEKGFLQPMAYASRILNKAEKYYPQIERELLGVVFGVTKFRLCVMQEIFVTNRIKNG